jgi:hypothetical protein
MILTASSTQQLSGSASVLIFVVAVVFMLVFMRWSKVRARRNAARKIARWQQMQPAELEREVEQRRRRFRRLDVVGWGMVAVSVLLWVALAVLALATSGEWLIIAVVFAAGSALSVGIWRFRRQRL